MNQTLNSKNIFKNKKVLLVGLGRLGGGLAMAKFFIARGARLTVTDLKTATELRDSIKKLNAYFKKVSLSRTPSIKMVLGKHQKEDFVRNEIIACSPAVSIDSMLIKLAFKAKKRVENDLSLFLELLRGRNVDYIAITGTRGKTTTTHWLRYFTGGVLGGNQPQRGFLNIIAKKTKLFVLELSSFQLEFMRKGLPAPKVAIVTNLYVDHINRHGTFTKYANTKANIFLNQTKNDFLILNADDLNIQLFLSRKPKSAVLYTSLYSLPKAKNGLFFVGDKIYFQRVGRKELITEVLGMSNHEKQNLLAAMLGARLYGVSWESIVLKIKTVPSVALRQEVIFKKNGLTVINDSAATSPEATLAALEKFKHTENLILITGGTDKQLEFKALAKKIKTTIPQKNLCILEGSATKKLIGELKKINYFKKEPRIFENLQSIIQSIDVLTSNRSSLITVLFSPGAASFEKFKNEFDRGKKFNELVRRYFKN